MLKTLERYQKCSYGAVEVNKPAKELEVYHHLAIMIIIMETNTVHSFTSFV